MPNWAEGNIRLRGKRENIINFIKNEIVAVFDKVDAEHGEYNEYNELVAAPTIREIRHVTLEENCGGESLIVKRDPDTRNDFYFNGSERQFLFIDGTEFEIHFSEGKTTNKDTVVVIPDFNGAWDVDQKYFSEKAKQYKIDIRIFACECGMCWSSFDTFYRDGQHDSMLRQYSDWIWNSPMPYWGG